MNKTTLSLIFTIIILAILAGGLWFLNSHNERNKNELFQLKKNIKSHEELPLIPEIERKIIDIDKAVAEVEPFLLDENNPVAFLEQVENLALENNVDLFVENAEAFRFEKFGGELQLVVIAEGSLVNLRNLVSDLENIKKEISIKSVRLSRTEDDSDWQLAFQLRGKTK